MTTLAAKHPATLSTVLRILALLALFFLQIEIVEIALRSYDDDKIRQSIWKPFLGSQRYGFSFLFVFIAAFLLAVRLRLADHAGSFMQAVKTHSWQRVLMVQVLVYVGFAVFTWFITTRQFESGALRVALLGAWMLGALTCGSLMLASLAPPAWWRQLLQAEKIALLVASLAGAITIAVTTTLIQFWTSMVSLTLRFSEMLLRLVYADVTVTPEVARLGTSQFSVRVTPDCAGYEGISLIVVFLALYVWLFKNDLRFPRVLLLFPIGIAAMWLFNGLRIAALIAIGSSYSPEIALAGFHSNAGWIAFILVSLGLIALMNHVPFFNSRPHEASRQPLASAHQARALLLPLMVLLAVTLLSAAGTSGFDWLYPTRVLATAIALAVFWGSYQLFRPAVHAEQAGRGEAIFIGFAVFLLWLLLVPASAEQSAVFAEELGSAAPWVATLWLLFRFIGSAITVPLAEELAFRGYILSRLSGAGLGLTDKIPFAWLPFLASSLLFGVFHGDWFAGTLAGMGYALARYRHGRVSDAVIAHMTTNALLSAYVLYSQQWSYW